MDRRSSACQVVFGRYLGDATTLDASLGTENDREDPDEVVCESFSRRCFGLVSADTRTDEATVSIRHVGELWGRAWSVGAEVRSSRSECRKVGPRFVDAQGRPVSANAFTEGPSAVEEGGLLYSDETQVYHLSAAWFPTPALSARLGYTKLKQDEFGDADGIGLTAGWFFRRNLSAKVSFTRTRLDGALVPEFRDSDTASIRLLGRF